MTSHDQVSSIFKNTLFQNLFKTFHLAIQPKKLIIAFAAILVIFLVGSIMDLTRTVVTSSSDVRRVETELDVYLMKGDNISGFIDSYEEYGGRTGVFSTLWKFSSTKFHTIAGAILERDISRINENVSQSIQALKWAFKYHPFYSVIFGIIKLAALALAGGAICRIAAIQFARDEKPGLTQSVKFSIKNFSNFIIAPLAPILIITVIGILGISLFGLIGNIPYVGEIIMSLSMPIALLSALLITLLLIGSVVGFSLMFPTIAYESSDSFDAISRSFGYVYAKPWKLVFYTTVSAFYGIICYIFVRLFAFIVLSITHCFLGMVIWTKGSSGNDKLSAIWPEPSLSNFLPKAADLSGTEAFAHFWISLMVLIVLGIVIAFVISFYFSACTIIYALLRKSVDGTDISEVSIRTEHIEVAAAQPEQA